MQIIQGKKSPRYCFLTPCTRIPEEAMKTRQKRMTKAPADCIAEKLIKLCLECEEK